MADRETAAQGTPRVLFIAGWGRSGTTIIDNVLNAHPGVFSAGELHYLWERGLIYGRKCGCGEPVAACRTWQDILDVAYGGHPPHPRAVYRLQREVIRVRRTHRLWLRPLPAAAQEYAEVLAPLYPAVAEVTGARVVVDSSKVPAAAALLRHVSGIDPWLLHVVRDPRAVANSWRRPTAKLDGSPTVMTPQSPRLSTARWLGWNAYIEATAAGYGEHGLRMRYEDFAADPRTEIARVLAAVGIPAGSGPFLDGHTAVLKPNHTVSGNPSRFRVGPVPIRPDEGWRTGLPASSRRLVTALAMPMLLRYGYRVRG